MPTVEFKYEKGDQVYVPEVWMGYSDSKVVVDCWNCDGEGHVKGGLRRPFNSLFGILTKCTLCKGTGRVTSHHQEDRVNVKIRGPLTVDVLLLRFGTPEYVFVSERKDGWVNIIEEPELFASDEDAMRAAIAQANAEFPPGIPIVMFDTDEQIGVTSNA